jgi:hypothetical protein
MAKGIYRKLDVVLENISREMQQDDSPSIYSRGLRGEGYLGGYRQAIWDVKVALGGGVPSTRGLWKKWD